jgi:hypothetical protein
VADAPACQNCGKPMAPAFATRVNGGCLKAWYCQACNDWQPPVYRERLWTRDEWDKKSDKADAQGA